MRGVIWILLVMVSLQAASKTMLPSTYKGLEKSSKLLETKQYDEAIIKLNDLLDALPSKRGYDKAFVYNALANTYIAQEKYGDAVGYFEKALALKELPESMAHALLYTVAQLHYQGGEFLKSINALKAWFKDEKEPKANAYVMLAAAYLELERYEQAIAPLKQAITLEGKENHYRLLLSIYFKKERFKDAEALLKTMVVLFDQRSDWEQLVYRYLERKAYDEAITLYETMKRKDYLGRSEQWKGLAELYLFRKVPLKAMRHLQEGFKKGLLENSAELKLLLFNAAWLAREKKEALKALEEVALLESHNKHDRMLAELYITEADYKAAIKALKRGLEKENKDAGRMWLLLGIAYYEDESFKQARAAFEHARNDKKYRKEAGEWLKRL